MPKTPNVSKMVALKFYDKLVLMAPPGVVVMLPQALLGDIDKSTDAEQARAYRLVDWLIHDLMEEFYRERQMGHLVDKLAALPIIEDHTHAYTASAAMIKLSQEMAPNHLDHSHIIPMKFGAEAARLAIFADAPVQRTRLIKAVITACGPIAQSLGEPFWQKAATLLQELVASPDVKCLVSPNYDKDAVPLFISSDGAYTKRVQSMIRDQTYLKILEVAGEGRVSAWIRAAIDEKLIVDNNNNEGQTGASK